MAQIPFLGPAYRARSVALACQRSVNLYLEADESKGESARAMLVGTPGMRAWAPALAVQAGEGVRALYPLSNGYLMAVAGASVYWINASGAAALVGTLRTSTGPVGIDENGSTAAIADGAARYAVNMTSWVMETLSGGAADRVAFIDGYFAFNRPNSQQFDVSDLYSTAIADSSYASAEGAPDRLVSLIADHRELWLFGQTSTEVWVNSGNADFPFERLPQAFIQAGCAAAHSVCRLDNSVVWLGSGERGTGIVWRADGYRPVRISTHAIERAIQSYPTVSDAFAFVYQQDGHEFYVLTFPSADRTWAFDAATGEWHERAWFDAGNVQRAHRASCAAAYAGGVIVGDRASGQLAVYDLDTYTEGGSPIRRIRTAQHLKSPDLRRRAHRMLQIDMESGTGLQTGQGTVPQAMLRWSDDGGRTWGGEMWASFGRVGEYKARARWRRLGSAFDRVYELTIADPVKVAIVGAVAEID